jgi:hypothetical protein
MVSFISEPYHFELARDFVYPLCSIDPRECHLHSCQSSFRSRSLTPMEVVSINVELEKVHLHPNHPMKLSGKEDWVMNAIWSELIACSIAHARKKSCMGDREVFLLPTVPISSFLHGQYIIHHFLWSLSFHKSRDEISFRRWVVTPHVTKS